MMYRIVNRNSFKKDLKRCKKRGYNIGSFASVASQLAKKGKLPAKYLPHKLTGNYKGFWECHIKPDWLLIWDQDDDKGEIHLVRTGTHSDLFKK